MSRSALALAIAAAIIPPVIAAAPRPSISPATIDAAVAKIVAAAGAASEARARQGVTQVAQRWFEEDGDDASFTAFCVESFRTGDDVLAADFARLEAVMEQVDGHLHEIHRMLLTPQDLDTGTVSALDLKLGDLDLAAHVDDDLFRTKTAFIALLNFPVDTLSERLAGGAGWSRERWARSRLMDRWAMRVPAEVAQQATQAFNAAEQYIAGYDIQMSRLVDAEGKPLGFAAGPGLITHWGLRDELKSHYGEGAEGQAKQRAIQKVMERIVRRRSPRRRSGIRISPGVPTPRRPRPSASPTPATTSSWACIARCGKPTRTAPRLRRSSAAGSSWTGRFPRSRSKSGSCRSSPRRK
jgi:hypothetical protein